MTWNVKDIAFLYRPDVFGGTFDNAKMQERHDQEVQKKLDTLQSALYRETDPFKAMKVLHPKDHLQFLQNNLPSFKISGNFEQAVVTLYCKANTPFSSGGDRTLWNTLFESCDSTRLYTLGEPVTFESATVYRGSLSGFSKSLNWTPDKQRADHYAKRWQNPDLGGGKLYEVDITKSNILIYLKHRSEDLVILAPNFVRSAKVRSFQSS